MNRPPRSTALVFLLTVLFAGTCLAESSEEILKQSGVQGGLVVHVGCGDGKATATLHAGEAYLVQGLDTDRGNVEKARDLLKPKGLYGKVTVEVFDGRRLPYVDNLVNLVVLEEAGQVATDEVMRVLCPGGVAMTRRDGQWTKTVKPVPDDIDQWTHYLHDPSNNAVAHDTAIGPPRRLQWVGSPRWSRHHDHMSSVSAMVTTNGRVFYIFDEAARLSIQLPPKWTLIARDAFNGTVLWKRPIASWHTHLWRLKSGPADLPRRLVADGEVVFATLAYDAPLTALDAATGETIRTYEGTQATQEIIYKDGVLFLLVDGALDASDKPQISEGGRRGGRWMRDKPGQQVMAVQADTGRILWKVPSPVAPLSLAADAKRVFWFNGDNILCLDRDSGNQLWKSEPLPSWNKMTANYGPKLVLFGDVVLFSGGEKMIPHRAGQDTMCGLDVETGKKLWTAPHPPSGYQSPEDLLVVGGLVWSGETVSGRVSGHFTGRDPRTGEVKVEFDPNVDPYWFHHRCYMGKATDKYLLMSRTGIEFIDPQKKDWEIHHWVRGACLYGIMPANGMVYAPQHPCACYAEAKLFGMNALAAAGKGPRISNPPSGDQRLERGPAYKSAGAPPAAGALRSGDWPTYRGSATRNGFSATPVPHALKPQWKTELGGTLSSVVVANGKLLVASIDDHTVHALDADSGEELWSFVAGGRVDSPPTVWQGRVLFGSADGFVYCLRADDGQLAWRFLAAPMDERHVYFEQVESVWPVHGSVLVLDGEGTASGEPEVQLVAGRNMFVDDGLRFYRLHARTGRLISVTRLTDVDPENDRNLQFRHQVLQMPVAAPDILSSNGKHVYMKSQVFDLEGNRQEIGPHAGDFASQASVQGGEKGHIFCPTGFLDGAWWHRTYWVFGRSFAGGHGGYHRAGVFAPSGRILVSDSQKVYGFGRKPQYYKWTTPLEHQLFCAAKPEDQPATLPDRRGKRPAVGTGIGVGVAPSMNPTGKALTVAAWAQAEKKDGVVVARGGPSQGYALIVAGGKPRFVIRADSEVSSIEASQRIVGKWTHLAGVLTPDKKMLLYVDGKPAANGTANSLITADPKQGTEIGADDAGSVGDYPTPFPFTGVIDEVRIYHRAFSAAEIARQAAAGEASAEEDADLVLCLSFDDGKATDRSGKKNHGQVRTATVTEGKFGKAMKFAGRPGHAGGAKKVATRVQYHWTREVPLFVRAMAMADKTLFIAGPPDLVDEELVKGTLDVPGLNDGLVEQAESIAGNKGALLWALSCEDGQTLAEYELQVPPAWDGMAAAGGRLYFSTIDGSVVCFGP